MNFKDAISDDINNVFLNPDEFGEEHEINGEIMMVIVDNNEYIEREKRVVSNADGVYLKQILFYVSKNVMGNLPIIGNVMRFDRKSYTVTDAIDENGIYSVSLSAVKSS